MKGDINGDSKINLADVNYLLNYIAGTKDYQTSLYQSDLNEDSKIDLADVNYLLKHIAGDPNYPIIETKKILKTGTYYWNDRAYIVKIPKIFKENLPIIIILHGFGGDRTQINFYTNNLLSENVINNHILISIDGTNCNTKWINQNGKFWNVHKSYTIEEYIQRGELQAANTTLILDKPFTNIDINWLNSFIEYIINEDYFNTNNKFIITGYSNGSVMTNQLLIENNNPNIIKAIPIAYPLIEHQYNNNNFYIGGSINRFEEIKVNILNRKILTINGANDFFINSYGGYVELWGNHYSWEDTAFIFEKKINDNAIKKNFNEQEGFFEIKYDNVNAVLIKNLDHSIQINKYTKDIIENFLLN